MFCYIPRRETLQDDGRGMSMGNSKLTDTEWALVEGIRQDFKNWQQVSKQYPWEPFGISEDNLIRLLGLVNRLSKKSEEWISVSDKLPNIGDFCEIMQRKEERFKAEYRPDRNEFLPWQLVDYPDKDSAGTFRRRQECVTHWRPEQKEEK
jgi:hypothetical protein